MNTTQEYMFGNALELLPLIPDNSINMILSDLPYGTTQCKWDIIIPFEPLWEQYERVITNDGVIVLTASQPFTSMLIMSNLKLFRYCWVWEKSKATGFLDSNRKPLKAHEDIVIFYKKCCKYNPQMTKGEPYNKGIRKEQTKEDIYGEYSRKEIENVMVRDIHVLLYILKQQNQRERPIIKHRNQSVCLNI